MKHAREDYNRIQDPAGLIPADEPVFLLRAQDITAHHAVRSYARTLATHGGDPIMVSMSLAWADRMKRWAEEHDCKMPDLPPAAASDTAP